MMIAAKRVMAMAGPIHAAMADLMRFMVLAFWVGTAHRRLGERGLLATWRVSSGVRIL